MLNRSKCFSMSTYFMPKCTFQYPKMILQCFWLKKLLIIEYCSLLKLLTDSNNLVWNTISYLTVITSMRQNGLFIKFNLPSHPWKRDLQPADHSLDFLISLFVEDTNGKLEHWKINHKSITRNKKQAWNVKMVLNIVLPYISI